jgi:hypothetical protein
MAVSPAETLMPWQSIILEYEAHYRASKKTERAKVVKEVYKAVQSDCQAKNIPIGLTLHAFSDVFLFLSVQLCYYSCIL